MTTSVCTGSVLLGAAGVLDGLDATCHWLDMLDLEHRIRPAAAFDAGSVDKAPTEIVELIRTLAAARA